MKRNLLKLLTVVITIISFCGNAFAQTFTDGEYFIRNISIDEEGKVTYSYLAGASKDGVELSLKDGGEPFELKQIGTTGTYSLKNKSIVVFPSEAKSYVGFPADQTAKGFLSCREEQTAFTFVKLTAAEVSANSLNASGTYYFIIVSDGIDNMYLHQGNPSSWVSSKGVNQTGDETVVGGMSKKNESGYIWQVFTREQLAADLEATASEDNPLMATSFVNDPDFSIYRSNGLKDENLTSTAWTITNLYDGYNNRNIFGEPYNYCAESWRAKFDWKQTVTGLPTGKYRVKALATFCEYDNKTGKNIPYFYVTGGDPEKVEFHQSTKATTMENDEFQMYDELQSDGVTVKDGMSTSFKSGRYELEPIEITVINGEMTLGFYGEHEIGWSIWDDVQLEYLGKSGLTGLITEYNNKKTTAQGLVSKPMYKDCKDALTAAINAPVSSQTEAVYNKLIDDITKAIQNANKSITEYEKINSAITEYTNKAGELEASGKAYWNNLNVKGMYNNGEIENYDAFVELYRDAIRNQTEEGADMTELIKNPNIDEGTKYWTCYKNGGNGPLLGTNKFEYWAGVANNNDRGFDYYQTITGLKNGVYTLSAYMYNSTNGEAGISAANITEAQKAVCVYGVSAGVEYKEYCTVGDGDANASHMSNKCEVEVTVTDGTLRLGVKNDKKMPARWVVIDNFELKWKGASVDLTPLYEKVQNLSDELNSIKSEKMQKTITDEVTNGIQKALDVKTNPSKYNTLESVSAVINQLQTTLNNAKASIEVYKGIADIIEKADDLTASGQEAFAEIAEDIINAWKSGTITDGDAETKAIEGNYITAVKSQTEEGAVMTDAILNNKCDNGLQPGGWTANPESPKNWYLYDNATHSIFTNGLFHVNVWSTETDKGNTSAQADNSDITVPFTEIYGVTELGKANFDIKHDEDGGYKPGTYQLKALVRIRAKSGNEANLKEPSGIELYANGISSKTKYEKATNLSGTTTAYYSWLEVSFSINNDGKLDFGFHIENPNFFWLSFQTFELKYKGQGVDQEALNEAKEEAEDLLKKGAYNKDLKTALQNALNTVNSKPGNDELAALNNAISEVNKSIKIYQSFEEDYPNYEALAQELNGTAADLLFAELENLWDAYEAGTLVENNLEEVYLEYYKKQGPGDYTALIKNPSFEEGGIGWDNIGSGNPYLHPANNANWSMKEGTWFAEAWKAAGGVADQTISQTLTDMPVGKYTITARMKADVQASGSAGTGFYLFGNNEKQAVNSAAGETVSVTCEVTDGTLVLGVKTESTTANWICVDYFTLEYLGTASVEDLLAERDSVVAIADSLLKRPMYSGLKDELTTAIANAKSATSSTPAQTITELINAITNLQTSVNSSIAIYEDMYSYIAKGIDGEKACILDETGSKYFQEVYAKDEIKQYNDGAIRTRNQADELIEKITEALILASKKQEDDDADMSLAIRNPGFETGSTRYWNKTSDNTLIKYVQNTSATTAIFKDAEGIGCAGRTNEHSKTNLPVQIRQEILEMNKGYYILRFNAVTNQAPGTNVGIRAMAGDEYINITPGNTEFELLFNSDKNGFTIEVSGILEPGNYIYVDNFELIYKGETPSIKMVHANPGEINAKVYAQQLADSVAYYKTYETKGTMTAFKNLMNSVKEAELSKEAYALAQHYIDSATHYMQKSNVYSRRSYDFVTGKMKALQARKDQGLLETAEAKVIMASWIHARQVGDQVIQWYGFNDKSEYDRVPSQNIDLYPEYPVIYYMFDAWKLNKADGTVIEADENFHANSWSNEVTVDKYSPNYDGTTSGMTVPFIEYWKLQQPLDAGSIKATALDLKTGSYTLTIDVRAMNEGQPASDLRGVSIKTASVNKNGKEFKIKEPLSLTEGKVCVDGGKECIAQTYTIENVIVRAQDNGASGNGKVNISIDIDDNTNVTWLSFRYATLTWNRPLYWYEENDSATVEEKEELSNLIAEHRSKVIGFVNEEYATYTNVEQRKALDAAEKYMTVYKDSLLEYRVLEYIEALKKPWVKNDGDVNCIYNPDFRIKAREETSPLIGWEQTDTNPDIIPEMGFPYGTFCVESNSVRNFANNDTALAQRYSTAARIVFRNRKNTTYVSRTSQYHYGTTYGYELPLRQSSRYYLSGNVLYADQFSKGGLVVEVKDSKGKVVVSQTVTNIVFADEGDSTSLGSFKLKFSTKADDNWEKGASENYSIVFRSSDTKSDNMFYVSNLELFRNPTVIMKVAKNMHFGTFIAPFNTEIPNEVLAFVVTGIDDQPHAVIDSIDENHSDTTLYTTIRITDHVKYKQEGGTVERDMNDFKVKRIIPAYVPVILYCKDNKGITKATGGLTIDPEDENATEFTYKATANQNAYLVGTIGHENPIDGRIDSIPAPVGSYVLQGRSNRSAACFYLVGDYINNGTTYKRPIIPPYRAYLEAPNKSKNAKIRMVTMDGIVFDDVNLSFGEATESGNDDDLRVVGIYSINGTPRATLQKGINFIKMSDGTTRKEYVK